MSELVNKVLSTREINRHVEVVSSLAPFVAGQVAKLRPVDKIWQPSDFLPNSQSPTFLDEIADLRKNAGPIPTFVLVSLIGNLVTEEGLPMYESGLNGVEGMRDQTGRDDAPWAKWIRYWTAEEARHGRGLNMWLYLSGRANMRAVDQTIQWFIRNGFDPEIVNDNDPYTMLVYTSFQERATAIAHRRVARIAKHYGDKRLATLCGQIAADERGHEDFYVGANGKVYDEDPNGATIAMWHMFSQGMVMPGGLMSDRQEDLKKDVRRTPLFLNYAAVTQAAGIVTLRDYADVFDYLMKEWNVSGRSVKGKAQVAQDKLGAYSQTLHRLANAADLGVRRDRQPMIFSWLPGETSDMRTIDLRDVISETPLNNPQKRKVF